MFVLSMGFISSTLFAADNIAATGNPSVIGTPELRGTLGAGIGNVADDNGLSNAVYNYQWVHVDGGIETNIPNAIGRIYIVGNRDLGKLIKVVVTFTDDDGFAERRSSDPIGPVTDSGCGPPNLGGGIEVWRGVVTVDSLVAGQQVYGYSAGIGGELSDGSFEFDSRTATINAIYTVSQNVYLKIDVDYDPVTDQEFIGVSGFPTLQSLKLHFCDTVLDFNESRITVAGRVEWFGWGNPLTGPL